MSTLGRSEWRSAGQFDFAGSEYLEGHAEDPYEPGADPVKEVFASPSAIATRDEGLANLASLPVGSDGLTVRAQKGETSLGCAPWRWMQSRYW